MPETTMTITTNATSALEHAEYMARAGERLIEAVNADAALRIRIAESDDVSDDDEHDVQATVDERLRTMCNSIYEFRKRRDRALSTAAAAAGQAEPLLYAAIGPDGKVADNTETLCVATDRDSVADDVFYLNGEASDGEFKVVELFVRSPVAVVAGPSEAEEDAYIIQQLGKLLAEIAVIVKGPERPRHRHGYQDLPALVMELAAFKQAVLDPENQPSQFGTTLLSSVAEPTGWQPTPPAPKE